MDFDPKIARDRFWIFCSACRLSSALEKGPAEETPRTLVAGRLKGRFIGVRGAFGGLGPANCKRRELDAVALPGPVALFYAVLLEAVRENRVSHTLVLGRS